MQEQGDLIPRLEELISEQNVLIEKLRTDLSSEKEHAETLRQEEVRQQSHYVKKVESLEEELSGLKKLISDNGIKQPTQENFISFKSKIEQDLSRAFNITLHQVEVSHKNELDVLENGYRESVKRLEESASRKESLLEGQIQVLTGMMSSRVDGVTAGSGGDTDYYTREIQSLNTSLRQLQDISVTPALDPQVSSLNKRLTEFLAHEIALYTQLHSFKTDCFQLREESNGLKNRLEGIRSENKFVDLEHSLELCHHDKERLVTVVNRISSQNKKLESKFQDLLVEVEDHRQDMVSDITKELDDLFNYTEKLEKYLQDMVNFYKGRLNRYGFDTKNNSVLNPSEGELVTVLPKSGRLISHVKKCHKMIFCLNEVLKSLDINIESTLKKNTYLDNELLKLKSIHAEKVQSLDSHITRLNEKITACMSENRSLEEHIASIRSEMVCKDQFQSICHENHRLAGLNNSLEEELAILKEQNYKLTEDNICSVVDVTKEESKEEFDSGSTSAFVDSSITYGTVLLPGAVTSTPFHPKYDNKGNIESCPQLWKSILMEWIQRYHNIESEKEELEGKVSFFNFTFNRVEFNRCLLEQEIEYLKEIIKNLENKVGNHISLKEKCHILENENSILNIKVKYLNNLQTNLTTDNIPELCDSTIDNCNIYSSIDFNSFNSTLAKLNLINELQRMIRLTTHLKTKCKSKEVLNRELTVKMNYCNETKKSLENKIEDLITNNNFVCDKLFTLVEENARLSGDKRLLEIELTSLRDELNYLLSSKNTFGNINSSKEIIDAMKLDALKLLKNSIDEWTRIQEKSVDDLACMRQVDRLDARHHIEILTQNNNLLKNDKDELLLRLSSLQHQLHQLQESEDIDEGWFLELQKNERELVNELKEQREQHARVEEALRSTGQLHNTLQKQYDIHRIKLREISSLQKILEDEKLKSENQESQYLLMEHDLKEKDKIIQDVLASKKDCERKLGAFEKEFAIKEKRYQGEILHAKLLSQYSHNNAVDSQVKQGIFNLQNGICGLNKITEEPDHTSVESFYQQSIDSLRYYLQQDKANCVLDVTEKYQKKV